MTSSVSFFRPKLATREVSLKESGGRRRFLFSSEVLPIFGFEPGLRFRREAVNGLQGFNLFPDSSGVQRVYSRRYTPASGRRPSRETQIEISSDDFLASALPSWTERIHLTLRNGRLEARPVPNHTFSIRKSFRDALDPYSAFMALSAGVDAHCMASLGFRIAGHLEWRPPEARDIASGRDLTETGILTALSNSEPDCVFNEDIRTADFARIREQMNEDKPLACMHLCLQCDDYSPLKNSRAREQSVEDLTSTRDLFYDGLRAVEALRPVTVMVEQVPGFATSSECEVFTMRLRRWGYHVSSKVFDPVEYGALTSRKRYYMVASMFPGFEFPAPTGPNTTPVLDLLADELPNCRDVSHCKAVRDGVTGVTYGTGKYHAPRARHIKAGDTVAPTIFKSQNRQPKDAVFIAMPDGRYLFPSRRALQRLCDIPDSFTTEHLSGELAAETIGQSISYRMHHAIAAKLKEHLASCHAGSSGLIVAKDVPAVSAPGGQLALF